MRHLRQLCCAFALVCLLAPAALADDGIMHPQGEPPPPPPTVTGIMHPQDPADETQAAVLEIVLDLLGL